jgi:hypothetical protein
MMLMALLLACASEPREQIEPGMIRATWRPIQPPRIGLRCWYTYSVGHGGIYCEPDPSATHGAGY